jgi:CheY-like chemotaxis protein
MKTDEQRSGQDRRQHTSAGRRHSPAHHRSQQTDFVANVSHEIRTPMQAILAMIDLLGETPLTQQQARYVGVFKDAGEYLLSLLNGLLDYSRLESGDIQLGKSLFHLPQLVENIGELMRSRLEDKDIVFHCSVDNSLQPWRCGDPQRLRQILVNLADNAIKFTSAGEISIRVTALCADRVLLEVSDTGAGISEMQQQRIFDAFIQGDVLQDKRGVGLGLTICKHLAKAMDGDIHVNSNPGVGSRFVCELLLPAVCEADMERYLSTNVLLAEPFELPVLSVLVVDDSPLNCRVLEDMLGQLGSSSCAVSNGRDAVKQLLSKRYDLVLMDMRMPVMDGLSATRSIRYLERYFATWMRGNHPISIMAMSAGANPEEQQQALEAGCDDYLVKPLRKAELIRVLTKAASARDSRR